MSYKAFQDYYKEESIKHLLLEKHNDVLISPPFATEKCKDYSKIAVWDGKNISHIDLDLPAATSKTNAIASVNGSSYLIPYGIYDDFNIVVELKQDLRVEYHELPFKGKGQFYNVASGPDSACAFPLGYQDTQFLIYIDKEGVHTKEYPTTNTKCHMGTVYSNGKFWSMPRGDENNYNKLVSYDGKNIETFDIDVPDVARKYTDIVCYEEKLYSLPFGETSGLNQIVEFDTETNKIKYYDLGIKDFAKKFNTQVLVDDCIIGLPYGDEHKTDSDIGVIWNIKTKETKIINIGLNFGGKYRFRSGIAYNGRAVFLPSGSPNCPIMSIGTDGSFHMNFEQDMMFGRPLLHRGMIYTIVYNMESKESFIMAINDKLECYPIGTAL